MKPAPRHAPPHMTREYRRAMDFMRETLTRETALTDEERNEAIRKAMR